ncbi:MAG: hypothetical protein FD129_2015 [bacterium]|nr:MAG: hypothetical protein FD129_2015 [bacterium]
MKCESCYADNAAWTTACLNCGRPVTPIELCDNGHILAPGERECAACPKQTWPEVPAWSGPPMLRGVLLLSGALLDLPNNVTRSWIELRDTGDMLGLAEAAPGRVRLVEGSSNEGNLRLLVRPDGVRSCRRLAATGKLAWQDLPAGEELGIGSLSLRWLAFQRPGAR